MTERDAKNVFLKSLYDFTKSNKSGEILLSNIAVENPGTDLKQLSRICEGLKNAGWIIGARVVQSILSFIIL